MAVDVVRLTAKLISLVYITIWLFSLSFLAEDNCLDNEVNEIIDQHRDTLTKSYGRHGFVTGVAIDVHVET